MNTRTQIEFVVPESYSGATSAWNDWRPENPARGQAAVAACVAQDHLGGTIEQATVELGNGEGVTHHYNRLADGSVLDLAEAQFEEATPIQAHLPLEWSVSLREQLMSNVGFRIRHMVLARRVGARLFEIEHSRRPGDSK